MIVSFWGGPMAGKVIYKENPPPTLRIETICTEQLTGKQIETRVAIYVKALQPGWYVFEGWE
jgi:hypothetical protein